jgi:phosphatidylglycerophosphatase A
MRILTLISRYIASGCGSGHAAIAPGTWGSAASMLAWWILQLGETAPRVLFQFQAACVVVLVGWVATALVCRAATGAERDPQWIVVDEWAGIFITLVGVAPNDVVQLLLGFALFRFFDVVKPGPVGWAERFPGATGIMADDVVAGLLALGVMKAVL